MKRKKKAPDGTTVIVGIYQVMSGGKQEAWMCKCLYTGTCSWNSRHVKTYKEALNVAKAHGNECPDRRDRSDQTTIVGTIYIHR